MKEEFDCLRRNIFAQGLNVAKTQTFAKSGYQDEINSPEKLLATSGRVAGLP
jgi:hypothetical protein